MKQTLARFAISTISLYKRRYFWIMNTVAILCTAAGFGYVYWKLFPEILDQVAVPLHYNIHYGVDSFGDWRWIFLAPGLSLLLIVANNILAAFTARKDYVLSYMAIAVSTIASVLLLLAIIHIVNLNLNYYG